MRSALTTVPGALIRYVRPPDGVDFVDFASPGCMGLWEVSAQEVEADASVLYAMIHPDDVADVDESVQASLRDGTPWFQEWRIVTPSGRVKLLQGSGVLETGENGGVVWTVYVTDVTEARRLLERHRGLESELRMAQHLQSLGRVTTGIAHDFNNTLTVVRGFAECVLDALPGHSGALGDVEEILTAVDRSSNLTRKLLAFSRVGDSAPKRMNPGRHLRESVRFFRRLIGEAVEIRLDIAPDAPDVTIDPADLDRISANLIVNARDAMPDGGRLDIRVFRRPPGPAGESDLVVLEFSDTGEGMPPETVSAAFHPFFTTRAQHGGTGLGLSTVLAIVSDYQGEVKVESESGFGTTIRITLPASPPESRDVVPDGPDEAGPARPDATRRSLRVLVVEDDEAVALMLRRMLVHEGHQVRTVHGPSAAPGAGQSFGDSGPDVLLVDVVLPSRNGVEVAGELSRRWPHMKVVFMTGSRDRLDSARLHTDPDPTVLEKPFSMATLMATLADAVAH